MTGKQLPDIYRATDASTGEQVTVFFGQHCPPWAEAAAVACEQDLWSFSMADRDALLRMATMIFVRGNKIGERIAKHVDRRWEQAQEIQGLEGPRLRWAGSWPAR